MTLSSSFGLVLRDLELPLEYLCRARQELTCGSSDLADVGFKGEVPGVEEAHRGLRYITFERLGARGQEERIVLSPGCEQRWTMRAEVLLKPGVQRNVALIVAEQVKLRLGDPRTVQVEVVE